MISLTGRVALVTGASRGIGRAIATRLAGCGALVLAAARGDNAQSTVESIRAAGGLAELVALDVTDAAAGEAAVAGAVAQHGSIDVLVNNAGITRDQLMLRMKREDWDAVLATNLTSAYTLTQAALKPMIRQRQRTHHLHQLGGGAERQCRAGELRGVEGGPDWFCQGRRPGSCLAQCHGQRRGAGHDRDGHDQGACREGDGGVLEQDPTAAGSARRTRWLRRWLSGLR